MDERAYLNVFFSPGEKILWEGRPGRREFHANGLLDGLFGGFFVLFGGGLMGLIGVLLLRDGVYVFLPVLLLPMVPLLFGVTLIQRCINSRTNPNHTKYIITNRKIIILRERKGKFSSQLFLDPMINMARLKLYPDGRGTVQFAQTFEYYRRGRSPAFSARLYDIAEPERVQGLIWENFLHDPKAVKFWT